MTRFLPSGQDFPMMGDAVVDEDGRRGMVAITKAASVLWSDRDRPDWGVAWHLLLPADAPSAEERARFDRIHAEMFEERTR